MDVRIAATDTLNDPTLGYEVLFIEDSSGDWLDFADGTFKAYGDATTPTQALVEDTDVRGVWDGAVIFDGAVTGSVTQIIRQTPANSVYATRSFWVEEGAPLVDLARQEVWLGTHTGGFENLRVIDTFGTGVAGATIRVYRQADYDAAAYDTIVGVTATSASGYWLAPVPVTAGETYVVHIHKPFVVGPATQSITV